MGNNQNGGPPTDTGESGGPATRRTSSSAAACSGERSPRNPLIVAIVAKVLSKGRWSWWVALLTTAVSIRSWSATRERVRRFQRAHRRRSRSYQLCSFVGLEEERGVCLKANSVPADHGDSLITQRAFYRVRFFVFFVVRQKKIFSPFLPRLSVVRRTHPACPVHIFPFSAPSAHVPWVVLRGFRPAQVPLSLHVRFLLEKAFSDCWNLRCPRKKLSFLLLSPCGVPSCAFPRAWSCRWRVGARRWSSGC